MATILQKVITKFEFRVDQIIELFEHYYEFSVNGAKADDYLLENLVVYGSKNTGKTSIVREVLDSLDNTCYSYTNLTNCYSQRQLFEKILSDFDEIYSSNPEKDYNCTNFEEFGQKFTKILQSNIGNNVKLFVLVFDSGEWMRSDNFLLNNFLRIRELLDCPQLTTIWITNLAPDQLFVQNETQTFAFSPVVFFNSYTNEQLLRLLVRNCSLIGTTLKQKMLRKSFRVTKSFIEEYIKLILNIFYTNYTDLKQLEFISNQLFPMYCKPIVYAKEPDSYTMTDLYLSIIPFIDKDLRIDIVDAHSQQKLKSILNCPQIVRYLIVSAYLASRLSFQKISYLDKSAVRPTNRRRTNLTTAASAIALSQDEQLAFLATGPKTFRYSRIMTVFNVVCTACGRCEMAAAATSAVDFRSLLKHLLEMNILRCVGGRRQELTQQTFRCILNYEYVLDIAKSIQFNLNRYL